MVICCEDSVLVAWCVADWTYLGSIHTSITKHVCTQIHQQQEAPTVEAPGLEGSQVVNPVVGHWSEVGDCSVGCYSELGKGAWRVCILA